MNQKELGELRRRFRPEKSAISRIYGCYVNISKEILSDLDEPLGMMPQEEAEKYLGLLKKALSGTLGKNLIDIIFSTQQVMESEEHKLLSQLRDTGLKDGQIRRAFYEKVISSLDMEDSNYLILMAHDAYDVPHRGKDGETQPDTSDTVFTYIVCAICPVKDGKLELGYFSGENEFHSNVAKSRSWVRRNLGSCSRPLMTGPLTSTMPCSIPEKRMNFIRSLLTQYFIRSRLCLPPNSARRSKARSVMHWRRCAAWRWFRPSMSSCWRKSNSTGRARTRNRWRSRPRMWAPFSRTAASRRSAWRRSAKCDEQFGSSAALSPANLIDSKRFEVKTERISVSVDPEYSYQVETGIIDGKRYILIPADEGVEVNGMAVEITG